MAGGIRDAVMLRDFKLLSGFLAIWGTVTIGNLVLGSYSLSALSQPIAHSQYLWSALGMALAGWGSILLGGCPLRQLILAGEGNGDSAVTVLGMIVGRRRLPQLRSGRRGGFRGGGRHLCGRRHRHCRHGGGGHRIRGTAGHHGDPFAENGGCIA